MPNKICFHCEKEKNVDLFARANNCTYGDGHAAYCLDCSSTLTPNQKAAIVSKLWRRNNARKHKSGVLARAYGITVEQYDEMLKQQNSVCAVCGEPEKTIRKTGSVQRLCVDHNHETGDVRALLCLSCNTLLGHMEANPKRSRLLVKYLKQHNEL